MEIYENNNNNDVINNNITEATIVDDRNDDENQLNLELDDDFVPDIQKLNKKKKS